MKVTDFYEYLCEKIPASLTLSGDHDGMSCCPDPDREVKKAMICLDVTGNVIDEAIEDECDVILAHHPMIYGGIDAVDQRDAVGGKLVKLIKNGIAVMSFHTRLDTVEGGVNDILAGLCGITNIERFGENGICRIGDLEMPVTAGMLAESVKEALGAPFAEYSDTGRLISRVAVCGGSARSFVKDAIAAGADALVCGEMNYHTLTDSPETGISIIAAGHFYTENPVCGRLFEYCAEADVLAEITFSNRTGAV